MSIGVAFGGIASGVPGMTAIGAIMLAIGIGIQNFPEGAAVSLPLRNEGFSRCISFNNKKYITILTSFCSRSNDRSCWKRIITRICKRRQKLSNSRINFWIYLNDDIRCCFRIELIKVYLKI